MWELEYSGVTHFLVIFVALAQGNPTNNKTHNSNWLISLFLNLHGGHRVSLFMAKKAGIGHKSDTTSCKWIYNDFLEFVYITIDFRRKYDSLFLLHYPLFRSIHFFIFFIFRCLSNDQVLKFQDDARPCSSPRGGRYHQYGRLLCLPNVRPHLYSPRKLNFPGIVDSVMTWYLCQIGLQRILRRR